MNRNKRAPFRVDMHEDVLPACQWNFQQPGVLLKCLPYLEEAVGQADQLDPGVFAVGFIGPPLGAFGLVDGHELHEGPFLLFGQAGNIALENFRRQFVGCNQLLLRQLVSMRLALRRDRGIRDR